MSHTRSPTTQTQLKCREDCCGVRVRAGAVRHELCAPLNAVIRLHIDVLPAASPHVGVVLPDIKNHKQDMDAVELQDPGVDVINVVMSTWAFHAMSSGGQSVSAACWNLFSIDIILNSRTIIWIWPMWDYILL